MHPAVDAATPRVQGRVVRISIVGSVTIAEVTVVLKALVDGGKLRCSHLCGWGQACGERRAWDRVPLWRVVRVEQSRDVEATGG